MKELEGKAAKIQVRTWDNKTLFYEAKIIENINETHITFIDKYSTRICHRIQEVVRIDQI